MEKNPESMLRYLESQLEKGNWEDRDLFHECVDDCRDYCSTLIVNLGPEKARALVKNYPMMDKIVRI